jgi:hypothetical protein
MGITRKKLKPFFLTVPMGVKLGKPSIVEIRG